MTWRLTSACPLSEVSKRGGGGGSKYGGDGPANLRRRRRAQLGGFAPLVASDRVGGHRPKSWILQTIAQVYIEKIAMDIPTTTGHGLTLIHSSAQRKRFLRDRGCI